jgi:hypothetical protein
MGPVVTATDVAAPPERLSEIGVNPEFSFTVALELLATGGAGRTVMVTVAVEDVPPAFEAV